MAKDDFLDRLRDSESFELLPSETQQALEKLVNVMADVVKEMKADSAKKLEIIASAVDKIATSQVALQERQEKILGALVASMTTNEKPDYKFHVERDTNGQIKEINAIKSTH